MATEFGKALRILRINTGELSKTMAEKLGISVPYLNAIENGRRDIPDDMEGKIVSIYKLTGREKENIHEAILASKDRLKIDLTELAEKQRRVILTLANDDIDPETLDEICEMVNKTREEKNEKNNH